MNQINNSERPDKFEPCPGNHLDGKVSTVSLYSEGDTSIEQFDSFMSDLLWEEELYPDMVVLRVKGIVAVEGMDKQLMVQGVHDTYDTYETKTWDANVERKNTLGRFHSQIFHFNSKFFSQNCLKSYFKPHAF